MTGSDTKYEELAQVLYDALCDDPFYRTLENAYPDPSGAGAAMLRYYELSMRAGESWGRLGLPKTGAYGVSVWSVPLTEEDRRLKAQQKRQALNAVLGAQCTACFQEIERNMAVHEDALGLSDHWYLSILAVARRQQVQGRGASLLAPILQEADQIGVASYLTTFTPRNISFYERQGFERSGCFPEPVTGSDFHILIRQPKP